MTQTNLPWYQRTYRWGQTNLTEVDPARYDHTLWREQWRSTKVQGVIVNAGGIVAYYPSKYPLHHRAEHLGDRDLYGEIVSLAREDGLSVLARMDSNRADQRFYIEHPEWFAVDASGEPYRAGELFIACVNSPYYGEYIPQILTEIIERSQPDGFADNSWSGLDRDKICYCANCARSFHAYAGGPLPTSKDWDDHTYRQWIMWNYQRRTEIWDLNNRVTTEVGGPDCLWLGMNSGEPATQARRFRDYAQIGARSKILMLDNQGRRRVGKFSANGDTGKLIHGLMGWDALIPESMALYDYGRPTFRLTSKPTAEARMWALEGFAGGIQPWWHHIGSYHEDRRQYQTAQSLFSWHEQNESHLLNRTPIANIGVVWSQRNTDFYGRDLDEERVTLPYDGLIYSLIKHRIPYIPVNADHIEREAAGLDALVLPNVGALSDEQCSAIRQFVAQGGGIVATGETSLYDEWGVRRADFALGDLFGVTSAGTHHGSASDGPAKDWSGWQAHTYLRLEPASNTDDRTQETFERHPVLAGLEETDIISFGGRLEVARAVHSRVTTPLTFIPPFPIYPPETSWMRDPHSAVGALMLNESAPGRVAYLGADLDRRVGQDSYPDHARILANLARWAARGKTPIEVSGTGFVDCHLYRQNDSVIIHLVNLPAADRTNARVDELIPIGPLELTLDCAEGQKSPQIARTLVSGETLPIKINSASTGSITINIPIINDHEVVVIE